MNQVSIEMLMTALANSWGADTAQRPDIWGPHNSALGQCVPTTLIVQDYFGGDIVRYDVNGEHHYCNLINGKEIDLTRAQYTEKVSMTLSSVNIQGFSSIREKRLSDINTKKRYLLLKKRVEDYLLSNK